MPATWKTARVFISSTFRDMHAERDYLVKVVFPKLRARLEQRRIHLVDIDLRWGVTQEQADNDRVLDLCLDQIDTCRPFFIGLLGERYGWVPETLPDLDESCSGVVPALTGKSITELEILHGVLRNPRMQRHAAFCFRDPDFIERSCGTTVESLRMAAPRGADLRGAAGVGVWIRCCSVASPGCLSLGFPGLGTRLVVHAHD